MRVRRELRKHAQAAHFIEETGVQHRAEALFDAHMQQRTLRRRQHQLQHVHRQALGRRSALPVADRAATEPIDLQRALDALRIGGMDARSGGRVNLRKLRVQRRPAVLPRFRSDCGADFGVGLRHVGQAVEQRAEIQASAARQDRQLAARDDAVDRGARVACELRSRIRLPWIAQIEQVVRHLRLLLRRRLRGADVEAPIDQRRIHADDFASKACRELQRVRTLAGRSRAHQGDCARTRIQSHHFSWPS